MASAQQIVTQRRLGQRWSRFVQRARSSLLRSGRMPGERTAKTTPAVVASYLIAEVLHGRRVGLGRAGARCAPRTAT